MLRPWFVRCLWVYPFRQTSKWASHLSEYCFLLGSCAAFGFNCWSSGRFVICGTYRIVVNSCVNTRSMNEPNVPVHCLQKIPTCNCTATCKNTKLQSHTAVEMMVSTVPMIEKQVPGVKPTNIMCTWNTYIICFHITEHFSKYLSPYHTTWDHTSI